jgi:ribosomal protein S27E
MGHLAPIDLTKRNFSMIRVSCPKCKATLQAKNQSAGKVVACPKCGTSLRLPQTPAPIAKSSTPSPAAPKATPTVHVNRWKESGGHHEWVEARCGEWGAYSVDILLEDLKDSEFWPMTTEQISQSLQEATDHYLKTQAEQMNVRRWSQSDDPFRWMLASDGNWTHADLITLVERLKLSSFWPMKLNDIEIVLEQSKVAFLAFVEMANLATKENPIVEEQAQELWRIYDLLPPPTSQYQELVFSHFASACKGVITALNARITSMHTDNTNLRDQIATLERQVAQLTDDKEVLRMDYNDLLEYWKAMMKELETKLKEAQEDEARLLDGVNKLAELPGLTLASFQADVEASRSKKQGQGGAPKGFFGTLYSWFAYYKCPQCQERAGEETGADLEDSQQRVMSTTENGQSVQRVFNVNIYRLFLQCRVCGHKWCEQKVVRYKA